MYVSNLPVNLIPCGKLRTLPINFVVIAVPCRYFDFKWISIERIMSVQRALGRERSPLAASTSAQTTYGCRRLLRRLPRVRFDILDFFRYFQHKSFLEKRL